MNVLDIVELVADVPEQGLRSGAEGTVVHIFEAPRTAYEVEFIDDDGNDQLVTVSPDQVRRPSTNA